MIKTEYGTFDGDKWESISQICFKQNFREESYQEVKATPGDYGIEGFTRTGKVFQCYCPDESYSSAELYEKHRDKITTDLKKLKTYENQLKGFLGDIKSTQKLDYDKSEFSEIKFFSSEELDNLEIAFNHKEILKDFFKNTKQAKKSGGKLVLIKSK